MSNRNVDWVRRLAEAADDEQTEMLVGAEGRKLLEKYPYLGTPCDRDDAGRPTWQEILVRAFAAAIENQCFDLQATAEIMDEILDAMQEEFTPK